MTCHLCTDNYPTNALVQKSFMSYTALFYFATLKQEVKKVTFCIFNQWELNMQYETWVNIVRFSELYFNKTDSTALSAWDTSVPGVSEGCLFFTVEANSFHRLRIVALVWAAQSHTADSVWPDSTVTDVMSNFYVSYFFIHTSVIWTWRNCGRAGDEPVEVKGQALWRLETGFARN